MTAPAEHTVPPIATADAALVAIAERRQALKRARKRFLADRDADALHDLRVAIRRLRAALSLFEPAVVLPRRCRDRQLWQVGRRLADLRDRDVLRSAVTSDAAAAAGIAADLIEDVESGRRDALAKAERASRRRRTRRMLRGFARWERRPRFHVEPGETIGTALPPLVRAHAGAFASHPAWALKLRRDAAGRIEDAEGALDPDGVLNSLHALRRRAKRLRYELEIAAPLLGWDEERAMTYLRDIQDALGELQDVRVIEAALDSAEPVGDGFRHWLTERRYQALEQWRRLRRKRAEPVLALVQWSALPGAD